MTDTVPYRNLDEFFQLADTSEAGWEQTVSWIDCLSGIGRSLFFRANLAEIPDRIAQSVRKQGRATKRVPFVPPVNGVSLRAFNEAYFRANTFKAGYAVAHFETYTYPLGNLHDWNRMYGPRGFYQYQSVVPRTAGGAQASCGAGVLSLYSHKSLMMQFQHLGLRATQV